MDKAKRAIPTAIIIVAGVACFIFYSRWYQYHFDYQEQNQLFLEDWLYISGYLRQPAWLACVAGDWLTQFYYYRLAGPAILAIALCLLGLLTRKALHQAGLRLCRTTIAVIVMAIFFGMSMRYSFRLSMLLSTMGGMTAFSILTSLSVNKSKIRSVLYIVGTILTWWCFGNGIVAYTLLIILQTIIRRRQAAVRLIGIALMLSLIPLTKRLYTLDISALYTYPGWEKLSMPEWALEKDFGAEAEYGFGNWNKVEKMVERESNPSKAQLFFYNLVKAQRGELPEVLTKYPDNYLGTFEKIGPTTPLLTIKRMNELYWALGDMTFAERAAMQALVFSPDNRNVRMIRRLAEISLVTGNRPAADKYLGLLDKTAVYSKWAENTRQNSGKYIEKRKLINRKDTLRLSDNTHLIMMELLDSNPNNTVALDYMLCSDLLQKDIVNFKRDYDRYYAGKQRRLHPLYQQALEAWAKQ